MPRQRKTPRPAKHRPKRSTHSEAGSERSRNPPKSKRLRRLQDKLALTDKEMDALIQAIHDADEGESKTPEEHEQDQSWLAWAAEKAVEFGPTLIELFETVGAAL